MCTSLSILSTFTHGHPEAGDGAVPQIGVACVVAVAWARAPGSAEAGPHAARAADIEPQVYCRRLGTEHAANGLAPCSDLGCTGCTRRG